jgi:hypothetical protein
MKWILMAKQMIDKIKWERFIQFSSDYKWREC